MALYIDGTSISTSSNVYVDGVAMNNVYIDGTLVWTKASSSTPTWHTISTTPIELRTYDNDSGAYYTSGWETLSASIPLSETPTKIRVSGYYEAGYNYYYRDPVEPFDYFDINGVELGVGDEIIGSELDGMISALYWYKSGNYLYINCDVFAGYYNTIGSVFCYENFIITKVEAYY